MTPTDLPEWHVLAQRRRALEQIHIADLFDDDPQRGERFSFEAASLSVDLSRNRIDSGTLRALVALARASNLEKQRDDLLAGAVVNATEARPAWHTALRSTPTDPFVDPAWGARLQGERERFLQFAEQLRAGHVAGATGLALETVVCIGIGGSDLGRGLSPKRWDLPAGLACALRRTWIPPTWTRRWPRPIHTRRCCWRFRRASPRWRRLRT